MNWIEILEKLTPALVSTIIGLFGAWLAWRQYHLGREQLRLSLFEKRFEVVSLVADFFADLTREGDVSREALAKLATAASKAKFLFGTDVEAKLDDYWKRSIRIQMDGKIAESKPPRFSQERIDNAANSWEATLMSMHNEKKEIEQIFASYMRFDIRAAGVKSRKTWRWSRRPRWLFNRGKGQ